MRNKWLISHGRVKHKQGIEIKLHPDGLVCWMMPSSKSLGVIQSFHALWPEGTDVSTWGTWQYLRWLCASNVSNTCQLKGKISLSSSYVSDYPSVPPIENPFQKAQSKLWNMKQKIWIQIMSLSISVPFMPELSGPQFVHSTYLKGY